jgi:hypothetical protein
MEHEHKQHDAPHPTHPRYPNDKGAEPAIPAKSTPDTDPKPDTSHIHNVPTHDLGPRGDGISEK